MNSSTTSKKPRCDPPSFVEGSSDWEVEGEWFHYKKKPGNWLCQIEKEAGLLVYFHVPSGQIVYPSELTEEDQPSGEDNEARGEAVEHTEKEGEGEREENQDGDLSKDSSEGQRGEEDGSCEPDSQSSEGEQTDAEDDDDVDLDLEHCIVAASTSQQGKPHVDMQDRVITKEQIRLDLVTPTQTLCYISGVFDGHVEATCAEYVSTHLVTNILSSFRQRVASKPTDELEALLWAAKHAFKVTDKNFLNLTKKSKSQSGSTACVVLIFGPHSDGTLKYITLNVGDSRAVLARDGKAVVLTTDHKPDDPQEKNRIIQAGGAVRKVYRVARVATKIGGQSNSANYALATSRAFGDSALKSPQPLVICEPDVNVYDAALGEDQFIILASDGIFDVIDNQEAVNIVNTHMSRGAKKASEELVAQAIERKSQDDKTCTVIEFKWDRQSPDEDADSRDKSKMQLNVVIPLDNSREEQEQEEEGDDEKEDEKINEAGIF